MNSACWGCFIANYTPSAVNRIPPRCQESQAERAMPTSLTSPHLSSAARRHPARDEIDHLADVLEGRYLSRVEADFEGSLCGNKQLDVHERVPALDVMRRRRRRDGQSGIVEDVLEHPGQSSPDLILVRHERSLVVLDELNGRVEGLEARNIEGPAGRAIGRLLHEREPEPRIVLSDEGVFGGGMVDALDGGEAPLTGAVHQIVAEKLLHAAVENAAAHQPLVDDEPGA